MNKQLLYCLLSGLLCLLGCSEDKGNYDYTPLNDVIIANIPAMVCPPGSNIQITPTLSRSLKEGEENLTFSWEVDGKLLSTERNLNKELPAMPYGQKLCALTVTDKETGVKYLKTFKINIVNFFNYGYYFLTREQDGTTIMAYLPSYRDGEELPSFLYTSVCGDVTFGKDPMMIVGSFGGISALDGYFWTMSIITKEGEYPVIETNNGTFLPSSLVSETSFADKNAGYTFKPEAYFVDPAKNKTYISEGKLINYASGLLYRPAKHKTNYYWSFMKGFFTGEDLVWVFDELSRKFYVACPYDTDPELGIIGDAGAKDQVLQITDSPAIPTDEFIIGLSKTTREEASSLTAYTANNKGVHIYKYDRDGESYNFFFSGSEELLINGVGKDTKFVAMDKDIFLNVGNKIYTTPTQLPSLTEFISIPSELGEIVKIGLSGNETRLIVTTYDKNSTAERKGSVVFIDIQNKKITETFKNCIDECVSILGGNADIWGQTDGLGDDK